VSSCRPAEALSSLDVDGANALQGLEAVTCSPFLTSDNAAIYGLVADGVREVMLNRSDGTSVSVPVQDNFLLVVVDRHAPLVESMTWRDADGRRFTIRSPLPADAASDHCVTTDPAAEVDKARRRAASARADSAT
jgi:hypothetical protein